MPGAYPALSPGAGCSRPSRPALPSRRCHRCAAGAAQHTSPSSCTSRRSPRHPRDPHIPADATSVQAFGGDVGARRPVLVNGPGRAHRAFPFRGLRGPQPTARISRRRRRTITDAIPRDRRRGPGHRDRRRQRRDPLRDGALASRHDIAPAAAAIAAGVASSSLRRPSGGVRPGSVS